MTIHNVRPEQLIRWAIEADDAVVEAELQLSMEPDEHETALASLRRELWATAQLCPVVHVPTVGGNGDWSAAPAVRRLFPGCHT